jgi:hypothetical protein
MTDDEFLQAFDAGALAPAQFDHAAHLRAARALLLRAPFLEACARMRDGLRALARTAGRPALYHETVTIAFMSLVHARVAAGPGEDWRAFVAAHPELSDRALLQRHYRAATLAAPAARERFVLETLAPGADA